MKHRYISLGSACDVAMILADLRLRDGSYPFDWLWNLTGGLATVNRILGSDFQSVSAADDYALLPHQRFDHPVIVYKNHPEIVHMHSFPLHDGDAHDSLVKRVDRFRKAVSSQDHLHFVYYANFNESLRVNPSLTLAQCLGEMKDVASQFLSIIKAEQRLGRTSMLLVLQSDQDVAEEAERLASEEDKRSQFLRFGHTLSRSDHTPVLHEKWKRQWFWNVVNKTDMPLATRFRLLASLATLSGRKLVKPQAA